MSCNAMGNLVHAYADGEMDVVRSLEMEQHLRACEGCSRTLRGQQALRAALRGAALYSMAPARLRRRVRSTLREAGGTWWELPALPLRWAAAAAALACAVALAWMLVAIPPASGARGPLTQEVVSNHVRSLLPGHLTDVRTSDRHTLKPWFGGKVDFSPSVSDLAGSGFPLLGARLDYLGGRRVAALVCQRRKHIINVFVRPASGEPEGAPLLEAERGYNVFRWTRGGMAYSAVSDLNEAELLQFVQKLQR